MENESTEARAEELLKKLRGQVLVALLSLSSYQEWLKKGLAPYSPQEARGRRRVIENYLDQIKVLSEDLWRETEAGEASIESDDNKAIEAALTDDLRTLRDQIPNPDHPQEQ